MTFDCAGEQYTFEISITQNNGEIRLFEMEWDGKGEKSFDDRIIINEAPYD
jgi:hypothetical protein